MAPELIAALLGIAGGIGGVFVGMVLQQRSDRARLTFDLHAEFNNTELSRARTRAESALSQNPSATFGNLTEVLPNEALDAWLVIRFYQKLWIAIQYNHVSREIVPDLFGSIFFYWYIRHFQGKLVHLPYQSAEHIKDLKKWFDAFTDPNLLREWEARARADLRPAQAQISVPISGVRIR